VNDAMLLLGVDGGGTRCRARLADLQGTVLGEGVAGAANLHLGVEQSLCAVRESAGQCLRQAGLSQHSGPIIACLALAGASEPACLVEARAHPPLFDRTIFTTDAEVACVGAHAGRDGGIVIVGTGSIGWGRLGDQEFRIGGWGHPISDEGSGAWIGCEAVRRALWAHDGRIASSDLLSAILARFGEDPHVIVRWATTARPRDFGALAPLVVEAAAAGDPEGRDLMYRAAAHVDAMVARLRAFAVPRLALMGGLRDGIAPYLAPETTRVLVAPSGDALSGALCLAREEARRLAALPGSGR
jgi:glucosamine kinase